MILFLLAYLGGVLTILSPCILPVLPFVFARADRPFIRSGLPLLLGMAVTFAAVAILTTFVGSWAVEANQYGRMLAIGLLALFGITLLFPSLSEHMTRPLVALGARWSQSADNNNSKGMAAILPSLLTGVATGLLWAPCAGPVLGLILTGAALQGTNVASSLLLLAYAAGAATSLALALLIGGRVFVAMKRFLGAGEWIKRALGGAVLVAVVAIALGFDTGVITRFSLASTNNLEQGLLNTLHPKPSNPSNAMAIQSQSTEKLEELAVLKAVPPLSGAVEWLNSAPLTTEALKGKVVLVDFWTYSCINCLRSLPYVRAWAEKYKNQGLVVIGVHTPEFAFEKDINNVKKSVSDLGITYPVAIDNNYAIWRAFQNQYWPAHYFIDAQGRIRHQHFGEGEYDLSEKVIQQLLAEAGKSAVSDKLVAVNTAGVEQAPDTGNIQSPETYMGYHRAQNFISPSGVIQDKAHVYTVGTPRLNQWGLAGKWVIGAEQASLKEQGGSIVYQFHARDLHLVLGPAPNAKPIRFRITIDGVAPTNNHGIDVDANGLGVVKEQKLYQLIRQRQNSGEIVDHTFKIEFLDAGVQVYAFTFG